MPCQTNENGAVLIMIIVSMVVASIVGVAMVDLSTTATYGQLSATQQDRAYYLAESGGRYAVPLVADDVMNSVTTNIICLPNSCVVFQASNEILQHITYCNRLAI